ncbi:MAG TPA: Gfo/Idh/MocA family oxidoreductase [Bacillus sp. (in: firmicutes)]|nr:Gfo/Idh/MocA family oxidoreductase [Bacillus sp. (in: firmicutes)]
MTCKQPRTLKAGIVGTGFMAAAHIEALRRLGYVTVGGIAGSSPEKSERAARRFHLPAVYSTVEELLSDPTIEVVHNCTPNHLHYEINEAIIKAGKHILSEKPLTLTYTESARLVKLAKHHQVVHGVNFNYRQYPLVQHLRTMVAGQELGPVHFVHGHYLQDWLLYQHDYSWRLDSKAGGPLRTIGDIGSHWMDLIQHITGQRITAVMADVTIVHPTRLRSLTNLETFSRGQKSERNETPIDTEDFAMIWLEFERGLKGSLNVSQVSAGRKNALSFEMNGRKASAAWNQEEPDHMWIGYRDEPNRTLLRDPSLVHEEARSFTAYPGGHGEAWGDGLKNMMHSFYQAVLAHEEGKAWGGTFATFDDGHDVMCILDAISKSIESKSWTAVNNPLREPFVL